MCSSGRKFILIVRLLLYFQNLVEGHLDSGLGRGQDLLGRTCLTFTDFQFKKIFLYIEALKRLLLSNLLTEVLTETSSCGLLLLLLLLLLF